MKTTLSLRLASATAGLLAIGSVATVYASHTWANYHWGRTATTFTLDLGDNVSATWDSHLAISAADWSVSSKLDTVVKPGKAKRNCRATDGRIEVCSNKYGNTGWLGIAQIWISGEHITKGVVKVNDTYFDTPSYNTPEWRNVVMCQEIGHTLGLGHVDEDFNTSLGTCMDYSSDPFPNQHPNAHDYEMLDIIYGHLDSVDTVKSSDGGDGGGGGGNNGKGGGRGKPADIGQNGEWGRVVRRDEHGKPSLYELSLGNGKKVFTFVTWAN